MIDEERQTMIAATPTKLRNGSWGARVIGRAHEGQEIQIETRSGKSWIATVDRVLWTGTGSEGPISIVSTGSEPRRSAARSSGASTSRPSKPRKQRARQQSMGEPPEGPTLRRKQGAPPFSSGEVLAALLTDAEISACETRQGITALPVSGTSDVPADRRRVAVMVIWAGSLSDDDVEELDAWSHQHTAVVRLAMETEAAPLLATRAAEMERVEAAAAWQAMVARIDQPVEAAPEWATEPTATWHQPVMVHTGSYPRLYVGEHEVYYYVPGYFACDWDYPAVRHTLPLTDELRSEILATVERARVAGLLRTGN